MATAVELVFSNTTDDQLDEFEERNLIEIVQTTSKQSARSAAVDRLAKAHATALKQAAHRFRGKQKQNNLPQDTLEELVSTVYIYFAEVVQAYDWMRYRSLADAVYYEMHRKMKEEYASRLPMRVSERQVRRHSEVSTLVYKEGWSIKDALAKAEMSSEEFQAVDDVNNFSRGFSGDLEDAVYTEDLFEAADARIHADVALDVMSDLERLILSWTCGRGGEQPQSLNEIVERLNRELPQASGKPWAKSTVGRVKLAGVRKAQVLFGLRAAPKPSMALAA